MDPKNTPVIVSAARTPIGKFMGALGSLSAPKLGAIAIREAVKRAGVEPAAIQEVIMGNVVQGGVGRPPRARRRSAPACPARSRLSPSTRYAAPASRP